MAEKPAIELAADSAGGYIIEISVPTNGKISVKSMPLADEAGEMGEGSGQEYATFGEALQGVIDLYKSGGDQGGTGDEQYKAGFGQPAKKEPFITTMPKGGYK